jgi:hypothetical protein
MFHLTLNQRPCAWIQAPDRQNAGAVFVAKGQVEKQIMNIEDCHLLQYIQQPGAYAIQLTQSWNGGF